MDGWGRGAVGLWGLAFGLCGCFGSTSVGDEPAAGDGPAAGGGATDGGPVVRGAPDGGDVPTPDAGANFYAGEEIRLLIGFPMGGGYDFYGRVTADFLGRHIAGMPTVTAENLDDGSYSLELARFLVEEAPADGLTLGSFATGVIVQRALGSPDVNVDLSGMRYLGAPLRRPLGCVIHERFGGTTWEEIRAADPPATFVAHDPATPSGYVPALLNGAAGGNLNVQHLGFGDVMPSWDVLAGVADGTCGSIGWIKRSFSDHLESGEVVFFVVTGASDDPIAAGVPDIRDLATGEVERRAADAFLALIEVYYSIAMPEGVPEDRRRTLVDAYAATVNDPDFVAGVAEIDRDVDFVESAEVERRVHAMLDLGDEELELLSFFRTEY